MVDMALLSRRVVSPGRPSEDGELIGSLAPQRFHDPEDYLTDVVSRKATAFIDASAAAKRPFVLELATFAPHGPATPAPRDAGSFPDLKAPRTAAYDTPPAPKPKWQDALKPLSGQEKRSIDQQFAKRVRSVQAVDEMIGHLRGELKAKGIADNTYIVFSSDNGGNPPTYEAIRTPDALWVEYADGEREYYDVRADPDQLHNRASALTQSQRARLHATLTALRRFEGSKACTKASQLAG
ncbi:sulfatase-like hydrolase/transferase [Streptomyces adustus]